RENLAAAATTPANSATVPMAAGPTTTASTAAPSPVIGATLVEAASPSASASAGGVGVPLNTDRSQIAAQSTGKAHVPSASPDRHSHAGHPVGGAQNSAAATPPSPSPSPSPSHTAAAPTASGTASPFSLPPLGL
ncbi:MAG: hypothetical protein ABI461_17450, partial [Polyangiaceae bacterium]